jgi:uncharacterized protein (TIGR02284 family)
LLIINLFTHPFRKVYEKGEVMEKVKTNDLVIYQLVKINKARSTMFRNAAQAATDSELRETFENKATQSETFITDMILSAETKDYPEFTGIGFSESFNNWMALNNSTNGNTISLIDFCISQEEKTASEYDRVLEDGSIPEEITAMADRQLEKIIESIEELELMKNSV